LRKRDTLLNNFIPDTNHGIHIPWQIVSDDHLKYWFNIKILYGYFKGL
jgi:hypothetical protein